MVKKTKKTLTIYLLLILSTFQVPAQKRRSASSRAASSSFDNLPFDKSKEQLPPMYYGHSLVAIAQALIPWQRMTVKSEFETTPEYQERIARQKRKPLVGTLSFNSLLAFAIGYRDNEQFTAAYDADLGVMTVALKMGGTLIWAETSQRVGQYVGRNAFNRSVRVQAYRNDDYLLNIIEPETESRAEPYESRPRRRLKSLTDSGVINFSIVMGAQEGRAVKQSLRALVIGHLADDPYRHDYDRDTPEIDDPYDRYNHTYEIRFVPHEIWIYDVSSGHIYAQTRLLEETPAVDRGPTDYNGTFSPQEVTQKARIISRPEPQYTEEARKNQVSGTVTIKAVFSSSGAVTNIRAVTSLPYGLTEKAIEAAGRIRFAPAIKDGRAVSQYVQLDYNFNLY